VGGTARCPPIPINAPKETLPVGWVIWTRSANSHTGRRLSSYRTSNDPDVFPCLERGRPQMKSRSGVKIQVFALKAEKPGDIMACSAFRVCAGA
jgi:hypothetical protein